jgi:hypothetical protein
MRLPADNQMVGFHPAIWLFINHLDVSPFYLNSRLQTAGKIVSYAHNDNKELD